MVRSVTFFRQHSCIYDKFSNINEKRVGMFDQPNSQLSFHGVVGECVAVGVCH